MAKGSLGWLGTALTGVGGAMGAVCTDPSSLPAWLAGLGPVLGPLAPLFVGATGLGTNLLATAIQRKADAHAAVRDLLTNEHVTAVQAQAVRARLRRLADEHGWGREFQKLASESVQWFPAFVHERTRKELDKVNDARLVDLVVAALSDGDAEALDRNDWIRILEDADERVFGERRIDSDHLDRAAAVLADRFVRDTIEALEADTVTGGEAFAKVQLGFLSRILDEVRSLAHGDGLPADLQDVLERNLPLLDTALHEIRLLGPKLDVLTGQMNDRFDRVDERLAEILPARRSRAPFHRLPAATAGQLFGRDEELEDLAGRLERREACAVWGPAGMGKTALAAAAVERVVGTSEADLAQSPYPDGVVLLDLYRLKGDVERAHRQLAESFGYSRPDLQDAAEEARRACLGRRALIVFEGAEELGPLLHRVLDVIAEESVCLVLTRTLDQAGPRPVTLREELSDEESLALLRSLTDFEDAELRPFVGLLGGHPLALTWAGCELSHATRAPAAFLAELEDAPLPPVHQPGRTDHTLEWLFERSLRLMSDAARGVLFGFARLAHATAPLSAARAALPATDEDSAQTALTELCRCGMLAWERSEDAWRFSHVLAYQFARERAQHAGAIPRDSLVRLTEWVNHGIQARLEEESFDPLALRLAIQHAESLLDGEDDEVVMPLVGRLFTDVWSSLVRLGDSTYAMVSVQTALARLEELSARDPERLDWLHGLSACHQMIGDLHATQGDLALATDAYTRMHKSILGLCEEDPTNTGWQRSLSVSHNRIGDVQAARGDLAGAERSYVDGLAIAQRLAETDPTNTEWQRDLGISHDKIGDVLVARGDLVSAEHSYADALAIAQRLAETDPTNTGWQRDLSVSHVKIGDVKAARGDLVGAEHSYAVALAIAQRLAETDPTNTEWQRDLGISHERIGDVQAARGDLVDAERSYADGLAIAQRLAETDPTNTEWQRDQSVSHVKIGDVQAARGDLVDAERSYGDALAIVEALVRHSPDHAHWQEDLARLRARIDGLRD